MSESKILSRAEFLLTVLHQWGAATAECRVKLEAHDAALRDRIEELESFQGNYAHATKIERADTAAEVESLAADRDKWKDDHALQLQRWQGAVEREQAAEKQLDETQSQLATAMRERDEARTARESEENHRDRLEKEAIVLRESLVILRKDLDYQTDARLQDAKDNQRNFREWEMRVHDPIVAELADLREKLEAAEKDTARLHERYQNVSGSADAAEKALAVAKARVVEHGLKLPGTYSRCMSGHYFAVVRGDEECPACALRRERDLARTDVKWFSDLVNQIQVNIGHYKICGMVPQPGTPEYLESQITYICNVHADTIHTLNLMTSELAAAIEAGKADKALIDKMESLAWSKQIGNGLAIFPSTDRGGVPGWVIQDLGDEDGSNLGDSLSETQSTLRAAMQAAQVEKPE